MKDMLRPLSDPNQDFGISLHSHQLPSKHHVRSVWKTLGILIACWLLTPVVGSWGHSYIVDQHNDMLLPFQGFTISPVGSPVGQSFVPTLSSLDVVELQMNVQRTDTTSSASAFVRIRADNPGGTILGESSPVTITNPTNSADLQLVHFDFATPLGLTPSNMYLLEVVGFSGVQAGVFTSGGLTANSYANGTAFSQGAAVPLADLWFREGSSGSTSPPPHLAFPSRRRYSSSVQV